MQIMYIVQEERTRTNAKTKCGENSKTFGMCFLGEM